MKKKLLAALASSLLFTQCQSTTPPPPPAPRAPPVAAAPKPNVPTPPAPIAVAPPVEAVDAGAVDTLALRSETPGVDHLGRARSLHALGDAKGALTEARRALSVDANDEDALELIATLAKQRRQHALAAEAYGRLAALRPDDTTPLIAQARQLYSQKDFAGAAMAARTALERDPEHVEALHTVGLAQLAMGELKGAIASFERTVELSPGHAWALNNLGFAYLRANENAKAADVLTLAAEALPTVAYVHNNLGVALERTGRKDEALVAFQHAMDLSPKYVKARLNVSRLAKAMVDAPTADEATVDDPAPEAAEPGPSPSEE